MANRVKYSDLYRNAYGVNVQFLNYYIFTSLLVEVVANTSHSYLADSMIDTEPEEEQGGEEGGLEETVQELRKPRGDEEGEREHWVCKNKILCM